MNEPYAAELSVLGIRATFVSDNAALLDAALAGYAAWRGVDPVSGDAGVRLRLARLGGGLGADGAPPSISVVGPRLIVRGSDVAGVADAASGAAEAFVSSTLAASPERLTAELLDTLLLFMLTRRDRQPLHAAGLVRSGVAALLCAPSGVGKSTLALAAPAHGFTLLSDDAVYLESGGMGDAGHLRVWGWPRAVHLAPAPAAALVGSAGGAQEPGSAAGMRETAPLPAAAATTAPIPPALRLRNGKWKLAHALPDAWAWPPVAAPGALFLMRRGSGRASARRITPEEAVAAILGSLDPGFDIFRETLPPVLRQLTSAGAWQLTLSRDPAEALEVVRKVVERG